MLDVNDWLGLDKEEVFHYLRWNSYLSARHRLFYVATPKVACTTLKWWFAELEGHSKNLFAGAASNESSPELVIHDALQRIAPEVTGLTQDRLIEALQADEYFRFSVVRNPYRRIFSAWQSKLLLREPLQIHPYVGCDFFHLPVDNSNDIAQAFEAFLEHLVTREAPDCWDMHWTPQATLLRPDLISYTQLAQIENLQALRAALSRHLGPEIADPFAVRSSNESLVPYLPEFITSRSAELIRSLYAQDFELFGYDQRKPEAKEKFSTEQLSVALKAIELIRGRHSRLAEIRVELDGKAASLNQATLEIRDLQQQLNQILHSRSWRATAPLRKALEAIRGIRSVCRF